MLLSTESADRTFTEKMWTGTGYLIHDDTVYVARRVRDGLIKIGVSRCPRARVSELGGSGNQILAMFPGGGRRLESELHYEFRAWALPNETEWFEQSAEILLFLDRVKRGMSVDEALETVPYPFQTSVSFSVFFAMRIPGCTKTAANIATGIALVTLSRVSTRNKPLRPAHLEKVIRWSMKAGERYGYCIAGGAQ